MNTAIYCLFAVAGLAIIVSMIRTKRFFSVLFLTAVQGIITLFAAKYVGGFFGIGPNINAHTLTLSAIGGIPGVIFLFIAATIFKWVLQNLKYYCIISVLQQGRLAQLVEHSLDVRRVSGSSPLTSTTSSQATYRLRRFFIASHSFRCSSSPKQITLKSPVRL